MRWKWRLIWFGLLVLLWLFCSGTALAGVLSDRLSQFPDWQSKPSIQASKGDLVYPDWFAGDWTVTTTLVEMVAPLAPELVTPGFESNRQFLKQPVTFQVRFVEEQPRGLAAYLPSVHERPKPIVSDRAFNGLSLAEAYLGDRAVFAVKVDPQNPNRQITLLKGDRQLVSTVTGRATEAPDASQFITTELFQQEFRGTQQLYFNEVENTTAYHYQPDAPPDQPRIIANQVTAVYLSPQDPDYFKTLSSESLLGESRPVALYRYQMAFERSNPPGEVERPTPSLFSPPDPI
jgi:hypothetical protein